MGWIFWSRLSLEILRSTSFLHLIFLPLGAGFCLSQTHFNVSKYLQRHVFFLIQCMEHTILTAFLCVCLAFLQRVLVLRLVRPGRTNTSQANLSKKITYTRKIDPGFFLGGLDVFFNCFHFLIFLFVEKNTDERPYNLLRDPQEKASQHSAPRPGFYRDDASVDSRWTAAWCFWVVGRLEGRWP